MNPSTLAAYGLSPDAVADISSGPVAYKPADPKMDRQRWRFGVSDAFDTNATQDPTNRAPEPGMTHLLEG